MRRPLGEGSPERACNCDGGRQAKHTCACLQNRAGLSKEERRAAKKAKKDKARTRGRGSDGDGGDGDEEEEPAGRGSHGAGGGGGWGFAAVDAIHVSCVCACQAAALPLPPPFTHTQTGRAQRGRQQRTSLFDDIDTHLALARSRESVVEVRWAWLQPFAL